MSSKELSRANILAQIKARKIKKIEAAQELGITRQHLDRLYKKFLMHGATGLISKRRGNPSNNRLKIKPVVLELIKRQYADFHPTLAHEKITEVHNHKISVESVRQLMIAEGLWKGKKRKFVTVHQQRQRRSRYGELIQIDGSPHDWFEGRAETCCLLVFVDDATGTIMHLQFEAQETTEGYSSSLESYLKQHGCPKEIYSDRDSVFRVNHVEASHGTGETQFGRMLLELDIKLICAHSPQAKGRVERMNSTLQNRLVKELRLRGISDMATANQYLPEFIADFNQRFAKEPAATENAHRPLLINDHQLRLLLSIQNHRKLSKNLELSFNNIIYQVQHDKPGYALRGATVTVCVYQGKVTLLYKGKELPYKAFDKNNRPAPIVTAKQLIVPKTPIVTKPKADHPWKKYPLNPNKLQLQQSSVPGTTPLTHRVHEAPRRKGGFWVPVDLWISGVYQNQ